MHQPSSTALLCFALAGCAVAPSEPSVAEARKEVCKPTDVREIAGLFIRWNQSLATGDPHRVVANYAERSILLPTVSDVPRTTPQQKEEYFQSFLKNRPVGRIDYEWIEIGCSTAVDAGLYTFTFGTTGQQVRARYTFTYRWDGSQWLITSHHSSVMPESR